MKKLVVAVSAILAAVFITFGVVCAAQVFKGDANLDGVLTTTDARLVLQAAVGSRTLSGESATNADFDSDGLITTTDARKVLTEALGFTAIRMAVSPTKTVYYVGDNLSVTGAKIGYINAGREIQISVAASMVSGFDTSTAGTKTLTVTYRGLTTTFDIKVLQKTVDFKPNGMFNTNMVLQRDATVPVFGTASDGVAVTVSFAGQQKTTVAQNGEWRVDLDSMPANNTAQELTVVASTAETFTYRNLLVGDVWLCMGQSNMYLQINAGENKGELTAEEVARLRVDAANSNIRSFWAEPYTASTPQADITRQVWKVSTRGGIDDQSAYGMAFAQALQPALDVPVGIATLAQGSTYISQWIPGGDYYNAMIASIMPFRFKGMVWYQGENDCIKLADFATTYPVRFNTLVNTIREGFEDSTMPVIQTQIANFVLGGDTSYGSWAQMQDLQPTITNEQNNTYTVCNFDLNDDMYVIHPSFKKALGTRAANLVLEKVYKKAGYVGSSPILKTAEKTADGVLVTFDNVHSAISSTNEDPQFFACGADGSMRRVSYQITTANQILLKTNAISNVKTVRYINNSCTAPLLYDGELPVFGFNYNFY